MKKQMQRIQKLYARKQKLENCRHSLTNENRKMKRIKGFKHHKISSILNISIVSVRRKHTHFSQNNRNMRKTNEKKTDE